MRPRTLKLVTIAVVVLGAALGLIAASQRWFTVTLSAAAGHTTPLSISGSEAAPALTALSLAALALALALAIAGRIARIIIGALGVLLGACMVFAAIVDPRHTAGVRTAVSQATGITGDASVRALIAAVTSSAWPAIAIAGGGIVTIGAIAALVTGRGWPGGSRRYDAVRFENAGGEPPVARRQPEVRPGDLAVDQWDELTRGEDPSDR